MLGVTLSDPIRSLVGVVVATIEPTATLRAAADVLTDEAIGLLVVKDPRGTLGVVSERDIVRALSEGADPDDDRVEDHMTDDLATLDADRPIADAADAMMAAQIRHLVVTDDGELVGLVSIRDVVSVVLEELRSTDGVATTP